MKIDLNPGEVKAIREIFDILRNNVKHLYRYHITIENLMSIRNKIHSSETIHTNVPLTYKDQVIGEATVDLNNNRIKCDVTIDEGNKIIEDLMKPTPIGISSRKLEPNAIYEPVPDNITLCNDSYWDKEFKTWKQPPVKINHGDLVDIKYGSTTVLGRYIGKGFGIAEFYNYSLGVTQHIGHVVGRGINANPRLISDEELLKYIED